MQIALDEVKPEFEDIVAQFQIYLGNQDVWNAIITAAAGQFLIDVAAAGTTYNQQSIKRALLEAFLETSIIPSSAFAIMRMLGVHVFRKVPAVASCTLQNDIANQFTRIPAYSALNVGGVACYNRTAIIFNSITQTAVETDLYVGSIVREDFVAFGGPFQRYVLNSNNFTIADEDIFAYINNDTTRPILRRIDGIWFFGENEYSFYENTLPDGRVEVIFGNGQFGLQPQSGQVITFVYAITNGSNGNQALVRQNITATGFPNIRGVNDTVFEGGSNEKSADFYKVLGSNLYSSKQGAVTRDQHRAIVVSYGGVVDARLLGQAETRPDDPRYINLVEYALLTNSPWTDLQFQRFENWLRGNDFLGQRGKTMWSLNFRRVDPTPVEIPIDVEIYCRPNSDLLAIKAQVEDALKRLLTPAVGSLGYSVYQSDIHERCNEPGDDVQFVKVLEPLTDTLLAPLQYPVIGTLKVSMFYTSRLER